MSMFMDKINRPLLHQQHHFSIGTKESKNMFQLKLNCG